MPSPEIHDLIVIGSGPAGLNAALMASSEGITTAVVEGGYLGGQAVTSTKIKNYGGFRDGVTGRDLMYAMVDQAVELGAEIKAPIQAETISETEDGIFEVRDDGSEVLLGRTVLMSCGVQFRRHPARNMAVYLRRGVSYGSPEIGGNYTDRRVFVLGGANSAGQAALFLSKFSGCEVEVLVRRESIEDTMSAYLVKEINDTANINLQTQTEVVEVHGDGKLEAITVSRPGEREPVQETIEADRMFLLIGAVPKTNWMPERVEKDKYGFVLAGSKLPQIIRQGFVDQYDRPPTEHETCVPGLYVAGDVRSGTIKRIVLAGADGASVVPELHDYLSSQKAKQPISTDVVKKTANKRKASR